jgi:hypothetical protein
MPPEFIPGLRLRVLRWRRRRYYWIFLRLAPRMSTPRRHRRPSEPPRGLLSFELDLEGDIESLSRDEARRLADDLRSELHRHAHLYFVEARPAVSDEEYDRLYRKLQALERAFPEFVTSDSPTRRVGVEPQDRFETVAHAAPMLSLDSTQDPAEVQRFDWGTPSPSISWSPSSTGPPSSSCTSRESSPGP